MYTPAQNQLLDFAIQKATDFFAQFPVTVHGIDHALQVAKFAREIAIEEGVENVFLCELSGVLHDIGRVPEKYTQGNKKTHHELSYELLKEWFAKEKVFDILSRDEKIELLYGLRYHWCDAADDYISAIILRDADKLEMFGTTGLSRMLEWYENDPVKMDKGIKMAYYCQYWIRTAAAKKRMVAGKMLEPHDEYYKKYLQSHIEEIEL